MNILIMGDSWGRMIPNDVLTSKGHTVMNISQGGASNFGQLRYLQYQFLEKNYNQFDYIIWFHTEPARDFTEFVSLDYGDIAEPHFSDITLTEFYKDVEYMSRQNYKLAQELYERYQIPYVVVGGAGPLPDYINDYPCFVKKIKSWNKELCEFEEMPLNCYTHHVVKMIDFGNYPVSEVSKELFLVSKLEEFMNNRLNVKTYPDGSHPNVKFFYSLFDKILSDL